MYGYEQVPHILTWSPRTLATTSLLLVRIKNHTRVAAALTANAPYIGWGNAPFTVHSVEKIEEYMQREKPEWMEHVDQLKANTDDKDIDKAVDYLEKGMLMSEHVHLPDEPGSCRGLENLIKVIIEIAGGAQQFDEPVKVEWNGHIDLVTPDAQGSHAGCMGGGNYQVGHYGHGRGRGRGHRLGNGHGMRHTWEWGS